MLSVLSFLTGGKRRARRGDERSETPRSAASSLVERRPVSPVPDAPDPEVPAHRRRRRFTAPYKQEILRKAEPCSQPGQLGALPRSCPWRGKSSENGDVMEQTSAR